MRNRLLSDIYAYMTHLITDISVTFRPNIKLAMLNKNKNCSNIIQ